jgi:hypothetical protein
MTVSKCIGLAAKSGIHRDSRIGFPHRWKVEDEHMNWTKLIVAVAIVGMLVTQTGCIGPFNLTKSVHDWNSNVGSKWVNEGLFIVMVIVPVYGITMLGDAIIFNSIEFWGGENPIDPPGEEMGMTSPEGDSGMQLAGFATPTEDGYIVSNGEESCFVPHFAAR